MPKRFIHSITLTDGIVEGAQFASIEAADLPADFLPEHVVFADASGALSQSAAGVFFFAQDEPVATSPNNFTLTIGQSGDRNGAIGLNSETGDPSYIFGENGGVTIVCGNSTEDGGILTIFATTVHAEANFVLGAGDRDRGMGFVLHSTAQTVDALAFVKSSVTLTRVNKNGYFMTSRTSAPADGELVNSELAFWLDATPGATKAMFKAKDSGGTVRTGSVPLS